MIHGGIVSGYYQNHQRTNGNQNPISYYFGKNQTERVGENYKPGGSGNDRAAEFKTTADQTYNGGKTDLLTLTNASDEPTIDITDGPNNSVIQFPKGRYNLLFQGYTAAQRQANFRIELKQIRVGTDDLIITHTPGESSGSNPARTAYQLIWFDFIVEGTEKFYFLFPRGGASHRSHFLRIEKVA